MNIGDKIKTARISKGMTQDELAAKVGVQKSAVAKWENGRVSEIKRSNLKMLAKALELPPTYLLDEKENSAKDDGVNFDIQLFADNPKAMEFFSLFAQLTPENQATVLAVAKGLLQGQ